MARKQVCDHDSCECKVDPSTAVRRDGKLFCEQGCADGEGCTHEHCLCGEPQGRRDARHEPGDPIAELADTPAGPQPTTTGSLSPAPDGPMHEPPGSHRTRQ